MIVPFCFPKSLTIVDTYVRCLSILPESISMHHMHAALMKARGRLQVVVNCHVCGGN